MGLLMRLGLTGVGYGYGWMGRDWGIWGKKIGVCIVVGWDGANGA